jgi:large subunit ribosomal protein L25
LQVDVAKLELGDSILVGSLQVPPGIEVKADQEQPIVTVLAPQKAASEEVVDKESAGESAAHAEVAPVEETV